MRYKTLGKTGLEVSCMTVGTWAIGGKGWGEVNTADSVDAIHAMLEQGVNFVDTAPVYGDGESERVVGEALAGKRKDIILATKTALTGEAVYDGRRDTILRMCEESLRYLQTDYIDIYILHWPTPNAPIEESMGAMVELQEQGIIKHIGVSNYSKEQILEAEQFGRVDVLQPPYSMVERRQEDLIRWAHEHGLGIMSYGSLGAGILTGSIRSLPSFPADDMRVAFYDFFTEPKFSGAMRLLETLDAISAERGVPVPGVAINWAVQKPFIDTAIVGVRNRAEALENCAGMGWTLTDEEVARIDAAIEANL